MTERPFYQEESHPALSPSTTESSATPPTLFLSAKLLPPRLAPTLLPRPRLVERLSANIVRPVTLVIANAGSGKTTLVADFLRTQTHQFVWYQLEATDAHPSVFLGYITHGIRRFIPDFGRATLAYLQQSAAEVDQHPERAVDVFLNEVLDQVEEQLILVLDDYHHLDAVGSVHAAVDRLLAYLPDVIHTIIISRDAPPLRLSRLRSQSALAIIDRDDLLFTADETQALFRQVFALELVPEQLTEYCERTQGWITALQLVRRVLQRSAAAGGSARSDDESPDLIEILRQSERDIFEYFAEEVFADESEQVQDLLLRLSLLERIEADLCASLYPETACLAILSSLVRRNVFITLATDGQGEVYRLHPLFQSFLRRRFRSEVGRSGVTAEHLRMGELFLRHGEWERAMHHLLAAEEFERAAKVIAEKGSKWIDSGALALLVSTADQIPTETMERHPRALASRAEVYRLRGEYDVAQTMLRHATVLLHDRGDREGEAEALHSLAAIARWRRDFTAAFDYLDRAVELAGERSVVRAKCANTRGICQVLLSQWTEAEREFHTALQYAEEQGDEHYVRLIVHNLGLPVMGRGDFKEAIRWLRQLLRDNQHAAPVPQEAIAHLNMARCYLYRGDLEDCERHLNRALEFCQLFNLIAVRAEAFETYGDWYREHGDTGRAADFYERAERDYEEAGIDLVRRELIEARAMLKLQMGDSTSARSLLNQLIEARQALKDEMGIQTATLALSRVLIAQGEYGLARAGLEPALHYFRRHVLNYYEVQACLELALTDQAADKESSMLERLRRMLDLALRYDYEYWLQRAVSAHPNLFSLPEAAELLPPDLREQLATQPAPQPAAQPSPVAAPRPQADLTINMLGPVEIFRDPLRPFAPDAWTTRRARDILCFIASRRHRRASKDTIIEVFWGEAEDDSISKNFHPTVSHIRKALNSNQPLKQNFLLYRDGDYQLNHDFSYAIDTVEFDRLVAEGEAARRAGKHDQVIACYEAAIQLYRGEFMHGCYDEWVDEQRSYYREQYLHMLEALVVAAQKSKEWPRSLHLAQQILSDDPYREDIHCLIMRAHAAQGNRVAVKEQYEALRRLLRDELGVNPAAETQKIYQQLLVQ